MIAFYYRYFISYGCGLLSGFKIQRVRILFFSLIILFEIYNFFSFGVDNVPKHSHGLYDRKDKN